MKAAWILIFATTTAQAAIFDSIESVDTLRTTKQAQLDEKKNRAPASEKTNEEKAPSSSEKTPEKKN